MLDPVDVSAKRLVDEAITLAGARPTDKVTILGAGQIDVLIEFARRGFQKVECRASPDSWQKTDLVVAAIDSEVDLRLLGKLKNCLRKGGRLLIEVKKSMAARLTAALNALLPEGLDDAGIHSCGSELLVFCADKVR